jgi:hypothetical protein
MRNSPCACYETDTNPESLHTDPSQSSVALQEGTTKCCTLINGEPLLYFITVHSAGQCPK